MLRRPPTLLVRITPYCLAALWLIVFILLAYLNSVIDQITQTDPIQPLSHLCLII